MEQAIVDVIGLSRSFGHKTALDNVSFRASAGQVYGLVGSNGAGKTTLLKHLLGLLRATTGSCGSSASTRFATLQVCWVASAIYRRNTSCRNGCASMN